MRTVAKISLRCDRIVLRAYRIAADVPSVWKKRLRTSPKSCLYQDLVKRQHFPHENRAVFLTRCVSRCRTGTDERISAEFRSDPLDQRFLIPTFVMNNAQQNTYPCLRQTADGIYCLLKRSGRKSLRPLMNITDSVQGNLYALKFPDLPGFLHQFICPQASVCSDP